MKKKVDIILKKLKESYPDSKCHLEFKSPFELLVSTVLAAQCTDERVNMVMVPLYKSKYFSPADIVKDGQDNFRENIKSINFFNNKTKSVLSLSKTIVDEHGGKVPQTMDELTKLAGVGRKSASVILGNCFGQNEVIIVDTHLKRVATRLGLTNEDDPVKIEMQLKEIIPPDEQYDFSMRIGDHGRKVCKAKKPQCDECTLSEVCDSAFKF